MFTDSYVITGTRSQHSLPPFLHQSSFCRQANQVAHFPFTTSLVTTRRPSGFVYLESRKRFKSVRSATRECAVLIRCYGSRRVLLVVRGALFRVASFSASCRRVLFFYSIHSGPSHFVSVNPVSSVARPPLFPPPIYPSSPLPVSLQGRMTVDRAFCCQIAYLFKQTSGMQNHDMSAPIQPVQHPAFTRTTVGRKKTSCIRVNAGQEERPKRTLRGSRLHLLFICSSAFATKAFIRGMKLQEKGRAICEEGPEEVLSTLYTGLLLAVYLRYSPEYKCYRQESTKNRRQFPVGSVVSTGRNSDGNNAAGNWQPSPLRSQQCDPCP